MLLGSVLILIGSSMKIVSGADWCYESQVKPNHTCSAPNQWGHVSHFCDGRSQSPIDILTSKTLKDERLTAFDLTGYQEIFNGNLTNNGHTVQLSLPSSIKIKGGNLAGEYRAVQLHLHWGTEAGPGSEHKIDGKQFPMEMHIVHMKDKYYNLSEALMDPAGVAVLGFFFQESSSPNKKFDPIINALQNITEPSNSTTVTDVSLNMFILPQENMTKYFRYDGSLTTPDCDEAVVWTVFEMPILLSKTQLAEFSRVQFSVGEPMVNNYRPVQPLNDRKVYYSGGHVALVSTVLLIMSALLSSGFSLHTTA